MRLVQVKPKQTLKRQKKHVWRWSIAIFLTLAGIGVFNYGRPLPPAIVTLQLPSTPKPETVTIDWPDVGEASVGTKQYDFRVSNAQPKPVSTASMAKVITVLTVLEKHPLRLGETGPTLTMTVDDVQRYQDQLDRGGSHLAVAEGETLTQYQMLQAILLPSANNMADSLAIWAFGSLEQYQKHAQSFVQQHGLLHTNIGPDASGFDQSTTSTTDDLTTLGLLAADNPVAAQIAATQAATFSTAGVVRNTNYLLKNGILTGLKTGMNDGNTGGFIYTSRLQKANKSITIAGSIVNAGSSSNAVAEAEKLVASLTDDFEKITYVHAGQRIGTARTQWGTVAPVVVSRDASVVRWRANKIWSTDKITPPDATQTGQIGTLSILTNGSNSSTPIIISKPAAQPTLFWRITHFR